MTDKELQEAIQEVTDSINNLPKANKPLSKEERQYREALLLKKEILDRIKVAKEKGRTDDELYNSVFYGMLTSWIGKHPYLMSLVQSNFRWNAF